MKRAMGIAWEKWQQTAAEMKEQQSSMGGALRRMLNRKLSMAWEVEQSAAC